MAIQEVINKIMRNSDLERIIGNVTERFIGYIYKMNYSEAFLLTNDSWKRNLGGIPHNCFLCATSYTNFSESSPLNQEVLLLRVTEHQPLPMDDELTRTIIDQHKQRTTSDITDNLDGFDPITHSELQFGGIRTRIIGTFYIKDGELNLGSDVENYFSSSHLRVFKPEDDSLQQIVNFVDPVKLRRATEDAQRLGFRERPEPFNIGTIRYTSSNRTQQSNNVEVFIHPSDFLSRRTAIFGMTRTGKSNTVKSLIASVQLSALRSNNSVGQLIFDINGEYANANQQDEGSSIANVFEDNVIRYRGLETPGFEDLRLNFYDNPAEGLMFLNRLTANDPYRDQNDLSIFLNDSLEEPDEHDLITRWRLKRAIYQCILYQAGFSEPDNFEIRFTVAQRILDNIPRFLDADNPPQIPNPNNGISLNQACDFFRYAREANMNHNNEHGHGLRRDGQVERDWLDVNATAYLNVLERKNESNGRFRGYRAIAEYSSYHSANQSGNININIYNHLREGRIVILDLSVGLETIRRANAESIASYIFNTSMQSFYQGLNSPNIVLYIEEAHNLVGKNEPIDNTWPRIAKEGAKANLSLVYATQEPSSIHPNILANTENWFVTHINNDDELRTLSKFYDFRDFVDSIKTAQDVGFARIKTLSSPFVVPTQISHFNPNYISDCINEIKNVHEVNQSTNTTDDFDSRIDQQNSEQSQNSNNDIPF